ncbi:phenylalanine--tRNA ligase subunit alpha [Candidatus Woesearchaeota archaeon CG10_big_fil_rev_8_21_14_0_10_45_16]|nr:MAG: phenylalanine--tRNA ligase subunit alpha [Candidatus Woesearchaeota archaeon CG10_big_fil_rev_8_21_14_0_10_45_16]
MDLQPLIAKLHPLERQVLPALKTETELTAICKKAGMQEVEVIRSLQWLENKEVLKINSKKIRIISLDKDGKTYKEHGLPEKIFLSTLTEEFKGLNIITKKSKLSRAEVNACIGLLKRKEAIDIQKEKDELSIKINDKGKELLKAASPEEDFLKLDFPLEESEIKDRTLIRDLSKRGILKIEERKIITVGLTPLGHELVAKDIVGEVVNRLTSKMLKDGSWKKKEFRSYDVEINVPKVYPGKKHFVNEAVEYIRSIWLEMGFKEMTGNYVQSAFWDLDALFVPQDHPAREMQDTFYLKGKAELPELWKKVKAAHENGGDTGSKGWQYTFSEDETKKILLRTHTTVLSAQTISHLKKEDLPAKFFAVGKVFRNEALDWKHLFEFYQVEGIVIDPDANLKHLKGYLTQFYKKMGYSKVRMRPAHFPYTEPSLEVDVFHPVKKEWIELGGAGIFRPEVIKPLLGFDCPVLAWGQGMGRIISEYWKITDIRDLYKNDLKQLREAKTWLR